MPTTVFLVEDAPTLREIVALSLELMDEIELSGTAGCGEEALEKIRTMEPDVILVDGSLPGMSGAEFIEKARTSKPATRFIFFSGRDDSETVRAALDTGACGYLVKGGDPDELLLAVRRCMEGECYVSPTVSDWRQLSERPGDVL